MERKALRQRGQYQGLRDKLFTYLDCCLAIVFRCGWQPALPGFSQQPAACP
jgi:hypothetical protein